MPDLGKYTFVVLLAYGGTFLALASIIWVSLRSHKNAMMELKQLERQRDE